MKRKFVFWFFASALLLSIMPLNIQPVKASGNIYTGGWLYRKAHNITGSTEGDQTCYQMKIIVHYGNGTDSGENVYLNNHSQPDFDDIRFTWYNGSSGSEMECDYWLEKRYDQDNATFWVEIPQISNAANNIIYVYYGNPTVSSASNGDDTFLFWDDFETNLNKWTKDGNPAEISTDHPYQGEHGLKTLKEVSNIQVFLNITTNTAIRVWFYDQMTSNREKFTFGGCGNVDTEMGVDEDQSITHYVYRIGGMTDYYISTVSRGIGWHLFEITNDGSTTRFWIDGEPQSNTVNDYVASIAIGSWWMANNEYGYFDVAMQRKYCDPEPLHGAWASEERASEEIQPWISEVNVTPSAPNVVDEVDVEVSFESSMYPGVEEWGNLTQVGNTFSVNVSILIEGWVFWISKWSHTYHLGYLPAGSYQFEVYVNYSSEGYQDYWLERNVSFTVTSLEPTGPTASFTYSPLEPLVNGTVTFDASASKPGWNGTHIMSIVNYTWDFGDGNITTTLGPIVAHEYKANDTYTVTFNVTDTQGLWNTTSKQVTVSVPYGPTANFTYTPSDLFVGDIITFNASLSLPGWNGSDVPIVNYTWDFGDGNTTTTSDPIVTHRYKANDTYTVTLNVTDSRGLWNTTSKTITIHPAVRDIAVTNVVPLLRAYSMEIPIPEWPYGVYHVYSQWSRFCFKVFVKNEGELKETFDVTVYLNGSAIGTQTVPDLNPGANVTLMFPYRFPQPWDVTYTISANATVVPGETDTSDNIYVDGTVKVEKPGDASWDGLVDVDDLQMLGWIWQKGCGDPGYNPRADFNGDCFGDVDDLQILGWNWQDP